MGAQILLAALLRVRPLDQSGGRDEGSRLHAHSGRSEVGVRIPNDPPPPGYVTTHPRVST